jgi:hypothetical protein
MLFNKQQHNYKNLNFPSFLDINFKKCLFINNTVLI